MLTVTVKGKAHMLECEGHHYQHIKRSFYQGPPIFHNMGDRMSLTNDGIIVRNPTAGDAFFLLMQSRHSHDERLECRGFNGFEWETPNLDERFVSISVAKDRNGWEKIKGVSFFIPPDPSGIKAIDTKTGQWVQAETLLKYIESLAKKEGEVSLS